MSAIRISLVAVIVLVPLLVAIAALEIFQSENGKRVSTRASKRLMKEFRQFRESDSYKNGVFTVELVEDNIYQWNIKLFKIDKESWLYENFEEWKERTGKDHVMMRAAYNDQYPFEPPFVQMIYPILKGLPTGYICMELLTKSGWSSAYTIEPLVLQIAVALGSKFISFGQDNKQYNFDENERGNYEYWLKMTHSEWSEKSSRPPKS
uniref:Ubiquitin-conjugating enzyme E2 Q1 n=1 Tax=Aceria tosichella TaxID=561515 RepID=A0A6G1SMJ1_9ACAR